MNNWKFVLAGVVFSSTTLLYAVACPSLSQQSSEEKRKNVVSKQSTWNTAPITVTSSPPGIAVYIADKYVGKTPVSEYIVAGENALKLVDDCYHTVEKKIFTKMGEDTTEEIDLTPKMSSLKALAMLDSETVTAKVYVDEDFVGETGELITVPLCSKSISVETIEASSPWHQPLQLREGEISELTAILASPVEPEQFAQPEAVEDMMESGVGTGGGKGLGEEYRNTHWTDVTIKRQVQPKFPTAAKDLETVQAKCMVRFLIDKKGKPEDIEVDECHEVYHESVKTACEQWEFEPVIDRNGQAVKATFLLSVVFKLKE